jgi:hypothetical protein
MIQRTCIAKFSIRLLVPTLWHHTFQVKNGKAQLCAGQLSLQHSIFHQRQLYIPLAYPFTTPFTINMSSSDVLGTPVTATRRPCLSQEEIDSTSKRKKMNGDARQSQSYDTIEHKNAPDSSNTVPDKLACLKGRGQLGQDSGPADSNRVNKLSEFADKVRRMHEEIDAWAMMTLSKGIEEAPRKVTAMEQDYMDWCEEQKTLVAEDSIETSSLRPKENLPMCMDGRDQKLSASAAGVLRQRPVQQANPLLPAVRTHDDGRLILRCSGTAIRRDVGHCPNASSADGTYLSRRCEVFTHRMQAGHYYD